MIFTFEPFGSIIGSAKKQRRFRKKNRTACAHTCVCLAGCLAGLGLFGGAWGPATLVELQTHGCMAFGFRHFGVWTDMDLFEGERLELAEVCSTVALNLASIAELGHRGVVLVTQLPSPPHPPGPQKRTYKGCSQPKTLSPLSEN